MTSFTVALTVCAIITLFFDASAGTSLLSLNPGLDTSNIQQCSGNGKENCQAVTINNGVLDNISVGDQINLMAGLDVELTFKYAEPPSSFVFTAGGQWGEAVITTGDNRMSVYGSIQPEDGNVNYFIESCGNGCNVLYQRDSGFFNNYED